MQVGTNLLLFQTVVLDTGWLTVSFLACQVCCANHITCCSLQGGHIATIIATPAGKQPLCSRQTLVWVLSFVLSAGRHGFHGVMLHRPTPPILICMVSCHLANQVIVSLCAPSLRAAAVCAGTPGMGPRSLHAHLGWRRYVVHVAAAGQPRPPRRCQVSKLPQKEIALKMHKTRCTAVCTTCRHAYGNSDTLLTGSRRHQRYCDLAGSIYGVIPDRTRLLLSA